MSTNFPTSLDSYTTLVDNVDDVLAAHMNNRGDAIAALEAKVGVNTSAVATSHDYKLTHLPTQLANWDAGSYEVRAQTLQSDVTTGTAPFVVASTTVVTNLNADKVDGADLDTTTTLGTSDVKVPSQKAVKTYVDNVASTAVDINGGTIDGVTIGGAVAPTVTNLGAVTTCDINGGTVDGTNVGASTPATGAFTTLKVGTTNQGDILYDNGTSLVRLTPGTSGYFLKTQGAAANPVWAASSALPSVIAGTTSTIQSLATERTFSNIGVSYSIIKTFLVTRSGTLTVSFDLAWVGLVADALARIYRNGVAVGAVQGVGNYNDTNYYTKTADISGWTIGDSCELRVASSGAPNVSGKVRNFLATFNETVDYDSNI